MIKYLITIVLTIALCCACDGEDFSADPTLMPPATQTGANTFGCLIDGWVYTGQRYGPDHKASYYPAYNEDEKAKRVILTMPSSSLSSCLLPSLNTASV